MKTHFLRYYVTTDDTFRETKKVLGVSIIHHFPIFYHYEYQTETCRIQTEKKFNRCFQYFETSHMFV